VSLRSLRERGRTENDNWRGFSGDNKAARKTFETKKELYRVTTKMNESYEHELSRYSAGNQKNDRPAEKGERKRGRAEEKQGWSPCCNQRLTLEDENRGAQNSELNQGAL